MLAAVINTFCIFYPQFLAEFQSLFFFPFLEMEFICRLCAIRMRQINFSMEWVALLSRPV